MRAAYLVSAAVLALSVSVATAGVEVEVEYPAQRESAGVSLGVVAQAPILSYGVGYVARPAVGSVAVDVGAAVARRLAIAVSPYACPVVGLAEITIEAPVAGAAAAGGISLELDGGQAGLEALAQMLLVTPSYVQPYVIASLLIEILRDYADAITAIDVAVVNYGKVNAESVAAIDAAAISFTKILSDQSTQSDAASIALAKALADSITTTDAQVVDLSKVLADSVTASELVSKGFVMGTIAEGVGSADASAISYGKNLTDSMTAADAITGVVFGKNLSEVVTATELKAVDFVMGLISDQVTANDAPAVAIQFSRTFSEILTSVIGGAAVNQQAVHEHDQGYGVMSGTGTPEINFTKALTDSMTAADVITGVVFGKALADASAAADAVAKAFVMGVIAEAVGSADASTRSVGKNLSESMTAAETVEKVFTKGVVAESVTATDAPAKALTKPIADSTTVGDSIVISFNFAQIFEEQFTSPVGGSLVNAWPVHENDQGYGIMAGTSIPVFVFGKNPSDTVTAAEAKSVAFSKALADSRSSADAVAKSFSRGVVAETVGSTDSTPVMTVGKVFADTVTAGDAISISIENFDGFVNAQVVNGRQVN